MLLFVILLLFIGLSAGLAWFLISQDHGEKEPVGTLWLAVGLGFVGGIAGGLLEVLLIPENALKAGAPLLVSLIAFLAVGIIEEVVKFLPLALYIFKKPFFNEHTDGVIYFALAGLGFGLPENILYTIDFGSQAGISRIILTPFLHAATTGMVGYFLADRKTRGLSAIGVWPYLLLAMLLHGIYDFGIGSGIVGFALLSIVITFSLTAALFIFYLRAIEHDQNSGLTVVGRNNFCRSCGFPNTQHHLYCTHCGNHA